VSSRSDRPPAEISPGRGIGAPPFFRAGGIWSFRRRRGGHNRGVEDHSLGIGLAGLGTVGSGVVLALREHQSLIAGRTGGSIDFHVARALVRDPGKARDVELPAGVLTTDWRALVDDPEVRIVVELIGGTDTAFEIVAAALRAGKPVVTGNKALLAERGAELFALSRAHNTAIHFEAAVAGGIPIVKAVREAFVGNRIHSMTGIINGTSNYILERMAGAGLDFEAALAEAQSLGYAEANPTLDVNGWDAAHKAILLASLAYGFAVDPAEVHVAGIELVRPTDIEFANRLGYAVKLLAVVRERADGAVEIRVQPSFIARSHILASVHGVFNAVAVHGDTVGESLFYGRGAGRGPTASAVVADLVEAARGLDWDGPHCGFVPHVEKGRLVPIDDTATAYYVRFDVNDRPGVIAEIAAILAARGVGISGIHSPVNPESPDEDLVDMVFLLHTCPFGRLTETLAEVEQLDCVNRAPVVFRIETL
jgi:homoserine dehydrogenase